MRNHPCGWPKAQPEPSDAPLVARCWRLTFKVMAVVAGFYVFFIVRGYWR